LSAPHYPKEESRLASWRAFQIKLRASIFPMIGMTHVTVNYGSIIHDLEDLLADNAATKYDFHISLLDRWALDNPAGVGSGWEPYPTSLRVPNVFKAWQAGLPLEHRHFVSLDTCI
jgi:formylmethanofuran dehydrogenase subunit A